MQNPQSSLAASAADTRAAKTETETATRKAKRIFYYVPYAGPFVAHPKFAVGGTRSDCNLAWKEIMIMIISSCVEL
ncbi:hypothetical protein P692DRAFT_20829124, partial [Suillus brevipes Sb2]